MFLSNLLMLKNSWPIKYTFHYYNDAIFQFFFWEKIDCKFKHLFIISDIKMQIMKKNDRATYLFLHYSFHNEVVVLNIQ